MKKILILVALATMVASSSFGGIVGSKHDMLSEGATGTNDEVCVFCHTPHGGASILPLWNRNANPNANGSTPYTSASMDASTVLDGDGGLCMSCHDGSYIGGSTLINDPGVVGMGTITLDVGYNSFL